MESGLPGEKQQTALLQRALDTAEERSIAILIHKPLYHTTPTETGHSLSTVWNSSQAVTVYGRVPGGQTGAPVGSYSDVVNATINF